MLPTWEFVSARYLLGEIYLNYTTEFYCAVMLAFFRNLFFFFQLYYGILCGTFASVFMNEANIIIMFLV